MITLRASPLSSAHISVAHCKHGWVHALCCAGDDDGVIQLWASPMSSAHISVARCCEHDWLHALFCAGDDEGVIKLWDSRQAEAVATLEAHSGECLCACLQPLLPSHMPGGSAACRVLEQAVPRPIRLQITWPI